MKRFSLLNYLLLLTCLVLAWRLYSLPPATPELPPTDSAHIDNARIVELELALAMAQEKIAALEQQQAELMFAASSAGIVAGEADTATTATANDTAAASSNSTSLPEIDALMAAGIQAAVAEAIREQIAAYRLAMLNLQDRAQREGWQRSQRYANELRKLINPTLGVREQFGDNVYDRYLYADGKPNRVLAAEVYPDSMAAAAGIQRGDLIMSYAAENIYNMSDLKRATSEGLRGESVLVEVERGGEQFAITVPRGPLGIEMNMQRVAP
jgi:hypothetical protein